MTYFDFNATAPLQPAALAAWQKAMEEAWHNPSSPYRAAAHAHALLEEARVKLAKLLGGTPEHYVFTSGATESNNALFEHFGKNASSQSRAIVSAIEHPSVLMPARAWFPHRLSYIPVNDDGVADMESLVRILRADHIAVVSLQAANNETGVLQPWAEAARICHEHRVPFHCDATQWLGKLSATGLAECDFVTGSAHKFGGVKGAGFLKVSVNDRAFHGQLGGEQENSHRAGTENLPTILAMITALAALTPRLSHELQGWTILRDAFENALRAAVPGTVVVGKNAQRLWNTVLFIPPRHANTRWVSLLDRRSFQVSTGSACATGHSGPSHVLAAMGIDAEAAHRALRVSVGWETSAADWQALANALADTSAELDTG